MNNEKFWCKRCEIYHSESEIREKVCNGVVIEEKDVQRYIEELAWSSNATNHEKTLVACNIKTFYTWLNIKNSNPTTVLGTIDKDGIKFHKDYNGNHIETKEKVEKKKGGIKNILRRLFFIPFMTASMITYTAIILIFPIWWVIKGDKYDEFIEKRSDFFNRLHKRYWGE
jgi:hypothetical protein